MKVETVLLGKADKVLDTLAQFGTVRRLGEGISRFAPADTASLGSALQVLSSNGYRLLPVGGGSGFVGGTCAEPGTAILDLRGLRRVIDYDREMGFVKVEAGITLAEITDVVSGDGWSLPADFDAVEQATLGGIIASGMKPYRQGKGPYLVDLLTAVNGLSHMGTPLSLDPQQWWGSEGCLGVITEATLFLRPQSVAAKIYRKVIPLDGCEAVIRDYGSLPQVLSLEYYWGKKEEVVLRLDGERALPQLDGWIVERDSFLTRLFKRVADERGRVCEEDFPLLSVVPRRVLSIALEKGRQVAKALRLRLRGMAQLLDGRLLLLLSGDDAALEGFLTAWANVLVELGGRIAGSHGIGTLLPPFLPPFFSEADLVAMERLLRLHDPEARWRHRKLIPQRGTCLERR